MRAVSQPALRILTSADDAESCVCYFLLEMSDEITGAAGKRSFGLAERRSGERDGGEDERELSECRPDV